MTITSIALADLSLVTGGQTTAAPFLNNGTAPVNNTPGVTSGVGNMGWAGTRQFGAAGGFNSPTTGVNGPAGGLGGGGGGGGKLNPFENPRDMMVY